MRRARSRVLVTWCATAVVGLACASASSAAASDGAATHAAALAAYDRGVERVRVRADDAAGRAELRLAAAMFGELAGRAGATDLDQARAWSAAGTALALSGDRARAVLALRRAVALAPALPAARENLELLRRPTDAGDPKAATSTTAPSAVDVPEPSVRERARTIAAGVPRAWVTIGVVSGTAVAVVWLVLVPLIRGGLSTSRGRRGSLGGVVVGLGVTAAGLGGLVWWLQRADERGRDDAVIIAEGAAARVVPGFESETFATPSLAAGTEVQVIERREVAGEVWARVTIGASDAERETAAALQSAVSGSVPASGTASGAASGDTAENAAMATQTAAYWVPEMALEMVRPAR